MGHDGCKGETFSSSSASCPAAGCWFSSPAGSRRKCRASLCIECCRGCCCSPHGPGTLGTGSWSPVAQSLDGNGKGVTMAHGLPLLEGRWEGGHDLCPSPPEQWRSVVTATPITLLEGRREGGHGLCLSPLEKRRSVVIVTLIPHPKRKVGKWP